MSTNNNQCSSPHISLQHNKRLLCDSKINIFDGRRNHYRDWLSMVIHTRYIANEANETSQYTNQDVMVLLWPHHHSSLSSSWVRTPSVCLFILLESFLWFHFPKFYSISCCWLWAVQSFVSRFALTGEGAWNSNLGSTGFFGGLLRLLNFLLGGMGDGVLGPPEGLMIKLEETMDRNT